MGLLAAYLWPATQSSRPCVVSETTTRTELLHFLVCTTSSLSSVSVMMPTISASRSIRPQFGRGHSTSQRTPPLPGKMLWSYGTKAWHLRFCLSGNRSWHFLSRSIGILSGVNRSGELELEQRHQLRCGDAIVTKGKAPAFQFYVRDWLSDPCLRQASHAQRGIWMDCLCYMWEAPERGVLSGTVDSLCHLLRVDAAELQRFVATANVTKFADVTFCNNDVTLINRRMVRDEKDRKNTRLRVARHRENQACNADVTPPSSSSSSSSSSVTPIGVTCKTSLRDVCSERCEDRSEAPALPFIEIPIVGNGTKTATITEADVGSWERLFPGIDVRQSLRSCVAWNHANPSRRKTSSGWKKHVVSWLTRDQNRVRASPEATSKTIGPDDPGWEVGGGPNHPNPNRRFS